LRTPIPAGHHIEITCFSDDHRRHHFWTLGRRAGSSAGVGASGGIRHKQAIVIK
jgi:hypothetical protein